MKSRRPISVPAPQQQLVTNTYELFNSLLQVSVEAGLWGSLLWLALLGLLGYWGWRSYHDNWTPVEIGALGSLVSVELSSWFSNPLHILPIVGQLGVLAAFLPALRPHRYASLPYPGKWLVAGSLAGLMAAGGYYEYQRGQAIAWWQRAAALAGAKAFGPAQYWYARAYPVLGHEGAFLYNYGVEAALAGRASQGIALLEAARPYYTSAELYIYLGQAYEDAGQTPRAIWCYTHAAAIVPAYLYPKYKLFTLAIAQHQSAKAYRLGQALLAYPVKVDNGLVRSIKYQVASLLPGLLPKRHYPSRSQMPSSTATAPSASSRP